MALTEYMVSTGELNADYSYQVLLNGVEADRGHGHAGDRRQAGNAADCRGRPQEGRAERGQPRPAAADRARRPALGQLYYSMDLRYFLPVPEIKALDKGVILARQYTLAGRPRRR